MHLEPYVGRLRQELAIAAEAGGHEARELAERLTAPLESAIRLALLEALSVAAEEITTELAPGSVDLRLRRGEPEFVVTAPADRSFEDETEDAAPPEPTARPPLAPSDATDGATARINFRPPEQLKARIEQAAGQEGLSVNGWLVRAVAAALEQADRDHRPSRHGGQRGQRLTGWVK
jgi:hypothetical protein